MSDISDVATLGLIDDRRDRGCWCSNDSERSRCWELVQEEGEAWGCHLARSVTMSCHQMMHLLLSTLPSPSLVSLYPTDFEPMHHSVTRFHKYLHGGRFPDIRIPATRGGGYKRSREMHCKTMVNQRIHGLFPNPTLPRMERIILT